MKRVLVVDDERDVADALADLLADTYTVTVAYDGAQALGVLEAGGIDAVVLDLMMPVMSGEELMAELQRRGIAIPVVFASAAPDLSERAKRSRANDYIAKPFDPDALERKLLRLLDGGTPGGSSSSSGSGPGGHLPRGPRSSPGEQGARPIRSRTGVTPPVARAWSARPS